MSDGASFGKIPNILSREKNRAPAWCDRVLWKGSILEQVSYGSADTVRFSDHRPVFGTFKCKVSLVDEITKDDLSAQIYRQRKDQLRYRTGTGDVYEEDNEDDLLDFEPLAPGLPPPSSEQSKWWLNDGKKRMRRLR